MLYLKNSDSLEFLSSDLSTILKRRICETDNIILQPYSSNTITINTPVLSNYNRTIYTIELRNASSSGIHVSNCWVTEGVTDLTTQNLKHMYRTEEIPLLKF